jgi:DNA uptake protein ComE-like DNA-binding protein
VRSKTSGGCRSYEGPVALNLQHNAPSSADGPGISPAASIMWALVPFITLGWGTGFCFTYAASRLRSWTLGAFAGAYFVLGVTSFVLVDVSKGHDWQAYAGAFIAAALMAFGTAHAFVIRPHLVDPSSQQARIPLSGDQAQAVARSKIELQRRHDARRLLRTDPELARQLRIGRPDLTREYNDGGLVDVNHASAFALARLPGIDLSLANEIVATRDNVGGFRNLDDLSITLGITPQVLDEAADFLVFPRPAAPNKF